MSVSNINDSGYDEFSINDIQIKFRKRENVEIEIMSDTINDNNEILLFIEKEFIKDSKLDIIIKMKDTEIKLNKTILNLLYKLFK